MIKEVIERMKAKASRIKDLPDTITTLGAHGEITLIRVETLPKHFESISPVNGEFIVAHSETGHHHVLEADGVEYMPEDAMTAWVRIQKEVSLKHKRSHDTHRTLTIKPGMYRINHAREEDILGEIRRVAD